MVDFCPGSRFEKQKGQVLLIVVLVMIVALTVGLSLISRSITNLRTSTEEAESQKALAAAEAGIEQALESGQDIQLASFESGDVSIQYSTDVEAVDGTEFLVNGGNTVAKDDGADVWLSEYSNDDTIFTVGRTSGSLTIYWGEGTGACQSAALEITLISGLKDNPTIDRFTAEPCNSGINRKSFNNFGDANPEPANSVLIDGKTYDFRWSKRIPNSGTFTNGLILRIVPVYYDAKIGIKASTALPLQGNLITSTGEAGKTHRKINVFQGHPRIPAELLPYAIFSPEN